MNKIHLQQNKLPSSNHQNLFYLPNHQFPQQQYSQNFIKLFKNALNKVYSPKQNNLSNQLSTIQTKLSQIVNLSSSKSFKQQKPYKKLSVSIDKLSNHDILTQRQKLIQQILNPKHQQKIIKKSFISKRCKTLNTKQIQSYSNQLNSDDLSNKNSGRIKLPAKLRKSYTMNRNRNNNQAYSLPPVMNRLSSNTKNHVLQNLQIIYKYKQLQEQYRLKQYLSSPIQIFSVLAPSFKIQSKQGKIDSQMSKLAKQSIIRTKTKKIKYALQDISHNNKFNSDNPENQELKGFNRIDQLMEQQQVLTSMWKAKQKKLLDIQTQNFGSDLLNKIHSKKNKLRKNEPLDEYFKPWQNSQDAKTQYHFNSLDIFQKTNNKLQSINAQEND